MISVSMDIIKKAVSALKNGELIVYPTDTLYGIGADIFNEEAVKKVFEVKRRPFSEPLSVAVSSYRDIEKLAYVNDEIMKIVKKFLPGPLTLVLRKKETVPDIVTAGGDSIAIRIPNNEIALKIVSNFGFITATSANIHNKPVPFTIDEIRRVFEDKIKLYIDHGKLCGRPSTIIDLRDKEVKILREGSINLQKIKKVIRWL